MIKLLSVKRAYFKLNSLNFGGVLEQPKFGFSKMRSMDGYYDHDTNMMRFNLVDTKGLDALTELVYHEMIHQYIDQFLELEVSDDHGKEFKKQYNKFCFGVVTDKAYTYE